MSILRAGGALCRVGGALGRAGAPTNTVVDGASFTINGTGFGTHGDYGDGQDFLCRAFTDFPSGVIGGGNWNKQEHATSVVDSLSTVLGGRVSGKYSLKKTRHAANPSDYGEIATTAIYNTNQTTSLLYFRTWAKMSGAATTTSADIGKWMRFYGRDDDNHDFYCSWNGTGTPTNLMFVENQGTNITGTAITSGRFENTSNGREAGIAGFPKDAWHLMEFYVRFADRIAGQETSTSLVTRDGDYWAMYQDGQRKLEFPSPGNNARQAVWSSFISGLAGGADLKLAADLENQEVFYEFDAPYLDLTWAHVEIGNASTFSACTIREAQLPTSWADGAITCTAYKGALTSGTNYLYVTKADGTRVSDTGVPVEVA